MKLLDFTEFVNEAALKKHFEDRTRQRIMDSLIVTLKGKTLNQLREMGISTTKTQLKIADLIRKEFEKKVKSLKSRDFSQSYVADIMLVPTIKVGDVTANMGLTVESVDIDKKTKKEIIKVYHGEMIIGYINHNEATTLKVFPVAMSHDELAKNSNDHHRREHQKIVDTKVIELESSKFPMIVNKDGSVEKYEKKADTKGLIKSAEKEYALSPGRTISVWIPFMKEFVPVEIIKVINRQSARTDGVIKVDVMLPDGKKLPKTLKPEDPVKIPAKDGSGWEEYRIAPSLFVDYANRGGEFAAKLI